MHGAITSMERHMQVYGVNLIQLRYGTKFRFGGLRAHSWRSVAVQASVNTGIY